ncbi:hypothetical protein F0562_010921 [Nyssa sinensis]|uniref:Uncharacterized protein n=1 Tax=Nyssa sinensis TaxID=561372 RepID=A0A5J5A3B1_9ASTE|nr:hypothetical protein F0562_010921 [Nyssa sinensis]
MEEQCSRFACAAAAVMKLENLEGFGRNSQGRASDWVRKKSLSLAVRCSDCERYTHENCVGNVSGLRQDGVVVQIGVYEYWVSVMGFGQSCRNGRVAVVLFGLD